MDQIKLEATKRNRIGKQVKQVRREGKLPAILYGKTVKQPIPITLDGLETAKVLRHASSSSLIVINVDGEEHTTLVRDFQVDPLRGDLQHVDFLVVSLTETVRANVSISLDGEAPVVESEGGLLVTAAENVEVESLPQDLPQRLHLDVSVLENFGDALYVRDLVVPANVTILSDPDELLVVATAPQEELVEEEVVEEGELLEGEEAELAEGEAPAEGEAAAEAGGEEAAEGGE